MTNFQNERHNKKTLYYIINTQRLHFEISKYNCLHAQLYSPIIDNVSKFKYKNICNNSCTH